MGRWLTALVVLLILALSGGALWMGRGTPAAPAPAPSLPNPDPNPPRALASPEASRGLDAPQAQDLGPPAAPDAHLLVLYTLNIHGEMLPCGCTTGPLGGFVHRGGLLQSLSEEGHPSILLDGGNLLFGEILTAGEDGDRDAEARLLFQLARHHGLAAMAVGGAELALGGPEALYALRGAATPALLSANLFLGDAPAFPASAVFPLGDRRVGVIGVTERPLMGAAPADLTWRDPAPLVAAEAARLAGEVDLVLVLSNLDPLGNRTLAKAAPAVDFILGGESDRLTQGESGPEDRDGHAPFILPLPGQGRFVGRLDLLMSPDPEARPVLASDIVGALRDQRVALESLEDLRARIVEEEGQLDPARLAREGASLNQQVKVAEARLLTPRRGTGFAYAPLPVVPRARVDDVAAALIAAHRRQDSGPSAAAAERYQPGVSFVGNAGCRGCHPLQQAAWMGQAHAKAWDTLKGLGKEREPECLSCHSTGFKVAGGFFDVDNPRAKEGVGCESCHGPLSDHPQKRRFLQLTDEATCVRCHDAVNSPGFSHHASLPGVTCPAGVLTEGAMVGEIQPGR